MSKPLSPQLFAILSALVEERLGIHHGAEDLEIFSDKVLSRAAEAGFESALDYYYFLRYDAAAVVELEALADALVVGETYFFRELDALRAGVTHALLPAIAERGRARVWSAACATGEEPVSLALLLDEASIRDRTEIVATDISARAIARAKAGSYANRALRVLPPNPPPPGFSEQLRMLSDVTIFRDGPKAQVARSVIAGIDYRQLNLLDDGAVAALGTFDLVLCRNVLIYFADPTVKRVVGTLASSLNESGRLIIGASESLLRFGTMLRCEERGGAFLYARDTE
jgi:chemotaxis protein methyltransferase CheR